jgi:uncharacterized protein involved in response to NO
MSQSLPLDAGASERRARPRFALSAKGFRPFFFVASVFAALMVPLWLCVLEGSLGSKSALAPTYWHAHEMIFGFAVAVVAGFLLTAVGNWTKRETLVGAPLLALAALWIGGRVVVSFPALIGREASAAIDLAFLPALGAALARPLVAAKNRRNFVMLAVLAALFACNLMMHLDALGVASADWQRRGAVVAVDVVIVLALVIAGRVLPMFTRNATRIGSIRSVPALDVLAIGSMLIVTIVDAAAPSAGLRGALAAIAGALAAARTVHWGARRSTRDPLLWILHAGYLWIPAGLLLRAAAAFDGAIPPSLATHAFTVGAIGALTLGMMARVALGHTGRPLVAGKAATAAFVMIVVAALARVVMPIVAPGAYLASLVAAAALWSAAFATYAASYARILFAPRVDGKPG